MHAMPNPHSPVSHDAQALQEAEYEFPYHYVPQWQPDFTQCFYDGWGIHYVSTIEFLLAALAKHAFESVVDVGCGDGRLAREIALRFPAARVLGVDYSDRAIGLAKALNADVPSLFFESIDITSAHSLERHDIAVLMEVFEHIPPEAGPVFLRGIHRLLKPGGALLLTVPHLNQPLEPKHFRHFTVASIQDVLTECFEVAEVIPFERHGIARRALTVLLGNRLFILNHAGARNALYSLFKRRLFSVSSERECRRVFVRAIAK